ncbi:MAG: 5-dehydro-4-deoxy-D-glucuronate isomerase [Bacillota bacterium]|nr:5-dehydro-4-deoxy-D-glucuronate isomerase [Bacillota bacterium]
MEIRNGSNSKDVKTYDTARLREEFLIEGLFVPGEIKTVYSHIDRIILGSVCPIDPITLEAGKEIRSDYFLERREMGIINIGSKGIVTVDGVDYELDTRDGLYIGMGAKDIVFKSIVEGKPAKFYFNSSPAHKAYPVTKIESGMAQPSKMGSLADSNQRTIYKYIHPEGVRSCQLVMGLTMLETGSVWNTMPCHTHDRRMEVYFYFDMQQDMIVFHFMGEPSETRHIIVRNEQAVISPSWSIHSGCGSRNYSFIWGMAGENQVFSDQDGVQMEDLK